jgi:hypothetical protein
MPGSPGSPSPRVIRTGSDVVPDDLEDTYHRVGSESPPYDAKLASKSCTAASCAGFVR